MKFPIAPPRSALVCALDWGLGHVSRSTPLVRSLQESETRVVLASNGRSAAWWRAEFPALEVRELPDYGVTYSPGARLIPGLLASLPRISRAIRAEHALVEEWVRLGRYDLVVSDNRYGCRAANVKSVLLTHQLHLAAPKGLGWFEGWLERILARMTRRFDEIWVPDTGPFGDGLSGKLGHPIVPGAFPKTRYIGPISRFQDATLPAWVDAWDTVALVSGPEPSRSRFEARLRQILSPRPGRHLLIRGRPDLPIPDGELAHSGFVEVPHLRTPDLALALKGARQIVCRGGYSTVMDLSALGILDKRCLFVPTPGQTEQEYLARHLSEIELCRVVAESALLPGNLDVLAPDA